jgi:hypothetical protein
MAVTLMDGAIVLETLTSICGSVDMRADTSQRLRSRAFVTALGAAFGPKIYADFIQPKATPPPPVQNT